ncbi:MAG: sigma-E factor negative regulatory protein [Burkholderiaceae bacterium]
MAEEEPRNHEEVWRALSAVADGEADEPQRARCLELWSSRPDLRSRWHEYQVIGDVMRSDALAHGAAADAAFLHGLRARIAQEPARLIPRDTAATPRMPRWMAPAAMAAGVGAVALTLHSLWPNATSQRADASLAAARAPASAVLAVAPSLPPQVHVVNGQLIRDARLDRYLAAHRQGATGAALQMPGAVVRSVDTLALDDK